MNNLQESVSNKPAMPDAVMLMADSQATAEATQVYQDDDSATAQLILKEYAPQTAEQQLQAKIGNILVAKPPKSGTYFVPTDVLG